MCGILAIYDSQGIDDISGKASEVLDLMRPRGPDDSGLYLGPHIILGTRRLKVIDTSDGGHQPMLSDDKSVAISFNGMIYNYPALRELLKNRGYSFRSDSDTEVILTLYMEYGDGFVNFLQGMWGIAIWDSNLNVLTISRDRFGIKPLYKYTSGTRTIFASEIKVILALAGSEIKVADYRLHRFLMRGWMDDKNETFFENISHVPSGTLCRIDENRSITKRYWDLKPNVHPEPDDIYDKIESAVISELRSDVPLGIALSGGLDSTTIASIIGKKGSAESISAYTIAPPGTPNETPLELLKEYKFKHSCIYFNSIDLADEFSSVIYANDEPVNGINSVYQHALRQRINEDGVRVLLTGEGADEVFAGYERTLFSYFCALLESGNISELDRALHGSQMFLGKNKDSIIKQWIPFLRARYQSRFYQMHEVGLGVVGSRLSCYNVRLFNEKSSIAHQFSSVCGGALFENLYTHLFERFVPLVLRIEDRISGAHGIESRVPFLNHELVEMVWSCSFYRFMEGGRNKTLLRKALQDALPDSIISQRTKLRKPGNNVICAYDLLHNDILETLELDAWKKSKILVDDASLIFKEDANRRDPDRALFWLRVYQLRIWFKHLEHFGVSYLD